MLIKPSLVSLSLPFLAAAIPTSPSSGESCTTGSIQCCDLVESASSPAASDLLGLLGIVVQDVDALVGLTCSPITVSRSIIITYQSDGELNENCSQIIGVGNAGACSAQTVCCEDNSIGK